MRIIERLKSNLEASIEAKINLLKNVETLATFSHTVDVIVDRNKKGARLYIAGNGGSAADSQHLAVEFVSKFARDRAPLPAEVLTVDTSILTAIGNNYGYDLIFSRQLVGKATAGDVFLGITTSGKSLNILRALEQCRRLGIPSIVFCGHDGGTAKLNADFAVVVPGLVTSTIQELHIVLAHTLCERVEEAMFGK